MTIETENDRVMVSFNDAVAMLPEGDSVHTFRDSGRALIGADWSRQEIIDWLLTHQVELSGEQAVGMNHGLAGHDKYGWLFIETKKEVTK